MPVQMAVDEILFREYEQAEENRAGAREPVLRIYFSSEPWITVGYSHPEIKSVTEIPVCRRITGGGRVEHGRDLIFSVVAGKKDDESFGSVRISYLKIHEAVK